MHGKTSIVDHDGRGVFRGLSGSFEAARYHSLVVSDEGWPASLEVAARGADDRTVMALRHRQWPVHGVQFHPESIMSRRTPDAAQLHGAVMFAGLLEKLAQQRDLTTDEAASAMAEVMAGRATPAQIGGLLMGLRLKGERPAEVVGFATTMRANAVRLSREYPEAFDTFGTGGDGAGTFNVSSVVALVVAASGVMVAKHGIRSVSSRSGSADVFEALGVDVAAPLVRVERCLVEAGQDCRPAKEN